METEVITRSRITEDLNNPDSVGYGNNGGKVGKAICGTVLVVFL